MPNLIVRYRKDEIMAVPCPSMAKMEVDPDFILHITVSMLNEVKLGAMGKAAFYFKDSSQLYDIQDIRPCGLHLSLRYPHLNSNGIIIVIERRQVLTNFIQQEQHCNACRQTYSDDQ